MGIVVAISEVGKKSTPRRIVVVDNLNDLKKGEWGVYYEGVSLGSAPGHI
jgi:hypothetical protein